MASSVDYLDYCMGQMEAIEIIRYRKMMGEYLIYVNDVLVGGIYDDRLLVKDTDAGRKLMPQAETAYPYDGAKNKMIVVDCVDDAASLTKVMTTTAEALSGHSM